MGERGRQSPAPRAVRRHARQAYLERLQAVAEKYPLLVPPVYDKSPLLTHETIRALWFAAGEALRHARRLVCIGYSLPDSDLTMMHFLRTASTRGLEIEVVNQSPHATRKLQRLFARTGVQVRQSASGSECIPDFVSSLRRPKA